MALRSPVALIRGAVQRAYSGRDRFCHAAVRQLASVACVLLRFCFVQLVSLAIVPMDPAQLAPTTSPSAAFCAISVEDTAVRLGTSLVRGLESIQDAAYRRSIHGPNELSDDTKDSMLKRFAQQFYENPLILLLLGSAGLSFFMGNLDDAISITLAILIVVTGKFGDTILYCQT